MKKLILLFLLFVFFIELKAQAPKPEVGFRWVLQEQFSDEFDGNTLDTSKWMNSFYTGWQGRPPAKFEPSAVSVLNGTMQIKSGKLVTPQGNYIMYGGAVTSITEAAHYGYYEVKLKASKIAMSSTFWLSNSKQDYTPSSCTDDRYSQELDVVEAVGDTRNTYASFKSKMKSNTHYRYIQCGETDETFYSIGADSETLSSEVWENYHTYGMHWQDDQSATFYADGNLGDTVLFNTTIDANPFDRSMFIAMVTETYNWLTPYPTDAELNNDAINTTYYDWVRSYRLVPIFDAEPGVAANAPAKAPIFTEIINYNATPTLTNNNQTLAISYNYKANLDRALVFKVLDSGDNEVFSTTIDGLEGYGNNDMTFTLPTALSNGTYTIVAAIKPLNGNASDTIDTDSATVTVQTLSISDFLQEKNIKMYPNPTTRIVHINTDGLEGKTKVIMRNCLGQIVMSRAIENNKLDLDVSNINSKGIYFLTFTNNKTTTIKKLIIK